MGRSHDVVSIIFKAGGVPALLILVERKKKVASKRDILEECSFWGYFDLKVKFIRRGVAVPARVGDFPLHPFNLAFDEYYASCAVMIRKHPAKMPRKHTLSRLADRAIRRATATRRKYVASGGDHNG